MVGLSPYKTKRHTSSSSHWVFGLLIVQNGSDCNVHTLGIKTTTVQIKMITTVAVTTRALNLQPNYKVTVANPITRAVTLTTAAQKVIIVSSSGAVSNTNVLQRSMSNTSLKTVTSFSTTPVLSTTSTVQSISSSVPVKQKPKPVSVPANRREPIVIRSQNIQLKPAASVPNTSQDVGLKRIPMPGIANAAKILAKPGGCGKGGVGGVNSGGTSHVLVMNSSTTTSTPTRSTVSVVGQRLTVPVRTQVSTKQLEVPTTFQTTKIIQGTTANSKPVIVLQKGGTPLSTQRGVTLTTATKELVNKVLMGKNVSTLSRPLVSVQKAATMLKPGTNLPFSTSQGNVIVLDLSQEHISKNATLAEILQASGIMCDSTASTSSVNTTTTSDLSVPNLSTSVTPKSTTADVIVESSSSIVSTTLNTNSALTTCTNTITSVQASSSNTDIEIQDWKDSESAGNENETIEFDLPFPLEEGADERTEGDEEQLPEEHKLEMRSDAGSTTESEDETPEGLQKLLQKRAASELNPSDDSSEKERVEKSDSVVVQGTSSSNADVLSSNDVSLDSFQMMQVESIGELPSEEVALAAEESQESSEIGNTTDCYEQLQEAPSETNIVEDNSSLIRRGSIESSTTCSENVEAFEPDKSPDNVE